MNSSETNRPASCPPEELIERAAVETLDPQTLQAITDHIDQCPLCMAQFQACRQEANQIEQTLRALAQTAPASSCLAPETLAIYLDQGLDEALRTEAETHLATCHACQTALITLYKETARIKDPDAPLLLPGEITESLTAPMEAPPPPEKTPVPAPPIIQKHDVHDANTATG